jgi:hypothetical protein
MTLLCSLCGLIIQPRSIFVINHAQPPGDWTEEQRARAELAEFDHLALQMTNHLTGHGTLEANEHMAVMILASKLHAMKYARCSDTKFSAQYDAWRAGLMNALEGSIPAQTPPAAPAAVSSSSEASTGS